MTATENSRADRAFHDQLVVSSSPHTVSKLDTRNTMLCVVLALLLPLVSAAVYFGLRAILLAAVCVAASVFFEWGYEKLLKQKITIGDLSACVTGLILALNLPANFPLWMAVIGCFAAIVVVKMLYGGLGKNFANPALVGRIVLFLSFTSYMSRWPVTRFAASAADAVTGATPLGLLADGAVSASSSSVLSMFLGNVGGAMGETCVIAILVAGLFLIGMRIISPIIPAAFLGTVFVFALVYYGITGGAGSGYALHMALFHLCAGGAMFGAFFCATDYVTSPVLNPARFVFGVGCGLVTMIIRLFCAYPEGVSFAILFMNVMTPLLNRYFINRAYGVGKKEKTEKKAAKAAAKSGPAAAGGEVKA